MIMNSKVKFDDFVVRSCARPNGIHFFFNFYGANERMPIPFACAYSACVCLSEIVFHNEFCIIAEG